MLTGTDDLGRQTACGDDFAGRVCLLRKTLYHAVNHAGAAVDNAGADTVHGVGADGFLGSLQVNRRQEGALAGQRVKRNTDAGRDHAAVIDAVGVHISDDRGGAHEDHDQRTAVFFKCTGTAAHDVAAEGLGTVDLQRHARFQPGSHHQAVHADDDLDRVEQRLRHLGHDRADDGAVDTAVVYLINLKKGVQLHRKLVARHFFVGRKPQLVAQLFPVKDAELDVGVADVGCQKHAITSMCVFTQWFLKFPYKL